MVSSMMPFHLICQDDQNEMWHDFLGHVMPSTLVLASHDVNGSKKGTFAFLTSRQLKWDATWLFGHLVTGIYVSIINGTTALLKVRQLKLGATWLFHLRCHLHKHWNHKIPLPLVLVSLHLCQHHVMWTASPVAPMHSLCQVIEMRCNIMFWSFDGIGTGISVTWSLQHHQWHQCIPQVKTNEMSCNITFWSSDCIGVSVLGSKQHGQWYHYIS